MLKTSMGAKTLIYPTPVLVVGTYDAEGEPNVMTAAWGGVACSNPPCVSVSLRAATASHGNIMERSIHNQPPRQAHSPRPTTPGWCPAGTTTSSSRAVSRLFVATLSMHPTSFPLCSSAKSLQSTSLGFTRSSRRGH